jgi:hypothetical protein
MPLSLPLKGEEIYSRGWRIRIKKTFEPKLEGFGSDCTGKSTPAGVHQE